MLRGEVVSPFFTATREGVKGLPILKAPVKWENHFSPMPLFLHAA
jgi:hypothetical protein